MKKIKKLFTLFTAFALLIALAIPAIAAVIPESENSPGLTGTVSWDDEENANGHRPESVTIRLYENGTETGYTTASAASGWRFAFDIGNTDAEYSITIDEVEDYRELYSLHKDPSVNVSYRIGGSWTKYEPCSELAIPTAVLNSSVIIGKMTGHKPIVVWSPNPLSETERQMVLNSITGQPGVGQPAGATFISGDGASESGMTVLSSEARVLFERPSNWALIYGGAYAEPEITVEEGQIVLKELEHVLGPVEPGTDTLPEETVPDPGTDVVEEPETELPTDTLPEETVTEPETDVVEEPETEPPTDTLPEETVTEPGTDITDEPATEPETETPAEPETDVADEPETESGTDTLPEETVTEPGTDITDEPATEPETEAPTEPEKEPATEAPTDTENEPGTEAPTEPGSGNNQVIPAAPESRPENTASQPELDKQPQTGDLSAKAMAGNAGYRTSAADREQIKALMQENKDIKAWIRIEGTRIDCPVMRRIGNSDYYLHRDMDGNESAGGTPYMGNKTRPENTNVLIYGHNMNDGSMFADLLKYEDYEFYKEHPAILVETENESAEYEIISVFREKVHYKNEKGAFRYYSYAGNLTKQRAAAYLAKIEEISLYETEATASPGDKLITLSTCSYHDENGRFVVVAVKK